jgi:hypothetical protein
MKEEFKSVPGTVHNSDFPTTQTYYDDDEDDDKPPIHSETQKATVTNNCSTGSSQ